MSPIESDPMFQLLTDALRAGPGSPEWHQAVTRLRAEGGAGTDEYKLLITARDHLESGKEFGSIRAGAGFTRELFAEIDKEDPRGRQPRGIPTATWIAIVSSVAILGVLVFIAYSLLPRGGGGTHTSLDEQDFFPSEVASARFEGEMPEGWRTIGELPLESARTGLRPASSSAATLPSTFPVGGAVASVRTFAADETFAIEVKLRPGRPGDDQILQVFVSTEDDFNADRATSSNELVWLLQGERQKVVTGASTVQKDLARPEVARHEGKFDPITIRLLVNHDEALVQSNGQRIWSGANGLAPKPRTVGVRFLRIGPDAKTGEGASVLSIKVLKK